MPKVTIGITKNLDLSVTSDDERGTKLQMGIGVEESRSSTMGQSLRTSSIVQVLGWVRVFVFSKWYCRDNDSISSLIVLAYKAVILSCIHVRNISDLCDHTVIQYISDLCDHSDTLYLSLHPRYRHDPSIDAIMVSVVSQ